MSKLKSLFVTPYMMATMGIAGYAVYQLIRGNADPNAYLGWTAALLTTLPFVGFLSRAMVVRDVARTSSRFPLILGLGIIGVVLAIYAFIGDPAANKLPMILTVAGFTGFLIYDFWYSDLGRAPSKQITVGEELPSFVLEDTAGNNVTSQSLASKPSLFMFYRGNWCPLCMAQVKELAATYNQLMSRGVEVILVSPQPHDNTEQLAQKFDVPFRFLVDANNAAAQILEIVAENGLPAGMQVLGYDSDTVFPTIILTDASGKVIFADQTDNYRVRPEPQTFIDIFDQHGVTA